MKSFPFFSYLLFSLLLGVTANAQNTYRISGIVKDNYNEPLLNAGVRVNNSSDSMVAGVLTDANGNFVVNGLTDGVYKVTVQFSGFAPDVHTVTIYNKDVDLGFLKLQVQSNVLKDVQITSNVIAVQQNGDTTSYNAKAYKTNPDATAEDLVRKMPGMDLSSGTPKAQGEAVTKVLVDNKPFFGNDATTALENLPASIIDKVQVYDEKSEQAQFTGFDDGNTTKTINIVTKKNNRNGAFGKLFAGYGDEGKYSAGGNVNYFNGNQRISLIGMTNNINVQNFSPQDLTGISSGNSGGRGMGRMGNAANNFLTNQQGGVSKTNSVGINYSDKWGKKIDVTASYFFNNSNNLMDQEINRIFVLPQQLGQTYKEEDTVTSRNFNHRFNLRLNYAIDSNNSILFVPALSFQKTDNNSSMLGSTLENETSLLNQTDNIFQNDQNAYNLTGLLLFRHKFSKRGRTLSLFANGSASHNRGNSLLTADNLYADSALNNTINQSANNDVNNNSINVNVNYTEPLSKSSYIQARYDVGYQTGNSEKYTYNYNPLSAAYTDVDTQLTNVFNSDYLTNSLGLAYRIAGRKLNAAVGANFQNAKLLSDGTLPEINEINRLYNNVLPYAFLRFKFNKSNDLSVFYRTNTDAPSVSQLQNVVNNQNPLQLSSGNPNLSQDYQHNLRIRLRTTNPNKSLSFFAMLSGTYIHNYIGSNTLVAAKDTLLPNGFLLGNGGRYTTQQNVNGYWNVSTFEGFGMPLNFLRSNLNVNLQAGYQRLPGLVNDQLNFANNSSLGLGLTLSSNISEKIDFTLSTNGNFNKVKNTINTASDNHFYNQLTRLSVNYIFWKGIVLRSDITNQFYTGLSQGYNQNFYLWNAGIAKKLFKSQQGEIAFSVYDLLGQNQSIQRTVSEIYSQDVRTNVLQRYFMLTFTYTLKAFKGSGADVPEGNMPPPPGQPFQQSHNWQHR